MHRTSRNSLRDLGLGAVLVFFLALEASAAESVNKNSENIAILGYDSVAYFTQARPVPGSPDIEHVWQEATWRFSSVKHRDLFASDPKRYAPRYGGFCAGAMARGFKRPIDPEAWVIVDDKLYLNYAKRVAQEFAADAENQIPKADANWERLGSE